MNLQAQSDLFHAFEWVRTHALEGNKHAEVLLEELVRLNENKNKPMEELIQVLASGGRKVVIEYTGDGLLQATVVRRLTDGPEALVIRQSTTAALALRDCAIMLVNQGAKL